MAKIEDVAASLLQFKEGDSASTPAAGIVRIYAKADGKLYKKDDAGTESEVGGGGVETHNTDATAHADIRTQINIFEAERKKYAKFILSANQSLANNAYGQIVWGSKTQYNGEDFAEIDSITKQIKITKDGMYQIELSVRFAGSSAGTRQIESDSVISFYPNDTNSCYTFISYFMYLTANTLLSIRAYQNSGGALDVLMSGTKCKIRKVS